MEFIQEVIQLIHRNGLSTIPVLEHWIKEAEDKTIFQKFYELLHSGMITTDEEAAQHFFQASANDPRYKRLKKEYKECLLNTLHFIQSNESNYNDYQKAQHSCNIDWAIANILIRNGRRKPGIELCKKILIIALKYQFSGLICDIAAMLRMHYGTFVGNFTQFDHYNELVKKYEKIVHAEGRAQECYYYLSILYANNKGGLNDIHTKASIYLQEINDDLQQYTSPLLHYYGYFIKTSIPMYQEDYTTAITVCDEAIHFFEQKEYIHKTALQIFLHQKLTCCVQLRDYKEGKIAIDKCNALEEEGAFNWFKNQELCLLLALHTKHYDDAYQIFITSKETRGFNNLPPAQQFIWILNQHYIHYLLKVNVIDQNIDTKIFSSIRFGRFVNECPVFVEEEQATYIPQLILQVLYFVYKNQYEKAQDRIKELKKYSGQYLKKNSHFRRNCFVKLLSTLGPAGFHKMGVKRKTEKLQKQLVSVSLDIAHQVDELEIIPYEYLWELLVSQLKTKFYKLKK